MAGQILLEELDRSKRFRNWYRSAFRTGNAIRITTKDDDKVEKRSEHLRQQGICKSNDQHIIALAHISGARLLYTRDNDLISDFKELIKEGKVYPTGESDNAKKARRRIHQVKNLCARS